MSDRHNQDKPLANDGQGKQDYTRLDDALRERISQVLGKIDDIAARNLFISLRQHQGQVVSLSEVSSVPTIFDNRVSALIRLGLVRQRGNFAVYVIPWAKLPFGRILGAPVAEGENPKRPRPKPAVVVKPPQPIRPKKIALAPAAQAEGLKGPGRKSSAINLLPRKKLLAVDNAQLVCLRWLVALFLEDGGPVENCYSRLSNCCCLSGMASPSVVELVSQLEKRGLVRKISQGRSFSAFFPTREGWDLVWQENKTGAIVSHDFSG